MPVGSGDHRLAATEGIGEGAGGDLITVEIGSDINIRNTKKIFELFSAHKAVVEDHLLSHPKLKGKPLKTQSIGFALLAQQMRMGSTQYDIDDLWEYLDHLR